MSFLKNIFNKVSDIFSSKPESKKTENKEAEESNFVDENLLEKLEEELIKADLGIKLSLDFSKKIKEKTKKSKITVSELVKDLSNFLLEAFDKDLKNFKLNTDRAGIKVFLILGVNGVGKTTSIGKLAYKFKNEGLKTLIVAGDTFRAAAEDQLRTWSERAGVDFFEMPHGTKASAVVFKAIEKAKNENHEIVLVDTAGRLQNKKNLMEELKKLKEVIGKNLSKEDGYLAETLLVLDASTGQNAISQAKTFTELFDLSGIILSKFDGTAKAGVVFSIAHELKIPVKLVGTGEKIEDIESFDPEKFCSKYF
jgi:fused signal recognition particle receptor